MPDKQIQTVGDILQKRRKDLKLDLADIALKLRIRSEHLEAIETDNLEALPAEAYALGFIRTYAKHLNLDETHLMNLFKQQSGNAGTVSLDFPEIDEKREIPGTALAFGLLGLVLTGYLFVAFLTDAKTVSQNKASQDSQSEQIIQPEVATVPSESSSATTTPKVPEEKVTLDLKPDLKADPEFAPELKPDAERGAIASIAQSPGTDSNQNLSEDEGIAAAIQVSEPVSIEPLPEVSAPPVPTPQPVFSIRARGETWMRVVNEEGRILFSSIIVAGEQFDFPAGDKFRLATQNAGRLEYVVDGETVGVVGGRGQTLANRVVNVPRLLERFAASPEM